MLVVKLELWRHGNPDDVEEIGRTYIYNKGGTVELGEYRGVVMNDDYLDIISPRKATDVQIMGEAEVTKWPRLAKHGWELVSKVLSEVFP